MNEARIIENEYLVIKQINEELNETNMFSLEYLLLRMSVYLSKDLSMSKEQLTEAIITETRKQLLKRSRTCRSIYESESNVRLIIEYYMRVVLNYYNNMMIKEQDKFDRYVEIAAGKMPSKKVYEEEHLDMEIDNIENTLALLNEAVRLYLELYQKRTLYAEFSNEEVMSFKIKEAELAHILGVNIEKIIRNPKLVDLLHITSQEIDDYNNRRGDAAFNILNKVIDIKDGNLLEYEKDRLKSLFGKQYSLISNPYDEKSKEVLPYTKINMRSKAFIGFKPLEELSLVLDFPFGYDFLGIPLEKRKNQEKKKYTLLISKNNYSDKFKYASLLSNLSDDRRYFESLRVSEPTEMDKFKNDGKMAITTKVILNPDPGSSGSGFKRIFTEEEQKRFLMDVYEDFKHPDLENLIEYFNELDKQFIRRR